MSTFDTLVLCGGGMKGVITLGALQYAIDQYLIQSVTKYIGTSIGAVICYLLIIGYTPIEIIVQLCTAKLESFKFFDVFSMTQGKGAMSFNSIQEYLEKMTVEKIGKFVTLGELKTKFRKDLICTTYNITDHKVEYLGPDNCPDLPCITALKMTTNLPLVFEKFKYMGKYYIDGGIADNFPIKMALTDKDEAKKVLGIVTFSSQNFDTSNILAYSYDLLNIPINELTRKTIDEIANHCQILKIDTKNGLRAFDMNVSSTDKLNMFSRGYKKAKKFFKI